MLPRSFSHKLQPLGRAPAIRGVVHDRYLQLHPTIDKGNSQRNLTEPNPSRLIDCGQSRSIAGNDNLEDELNATISAGQNLESKVRKSRRVLLLQGPVGPFFSNLQIAFENALFETKRVLFHSADALHASRHNTVRVSGDIQSWESWIQSEFDNNRPDAVVFFGSNRPAHKVAREVARKMGVEVIALEEGYLRPGYITCELGGNNQHSPLLNWKPSYRYREPKKPLSLRTSFFMMCIWGAVYYIWREFTGKRQEQDFYHRHTKGVVYEGASWANHIFRSLLAKLKERWLISRIVSSYAGNYILVPLQTPPDSQLKSASRGWSNDKLVQEILHARKIGAGHEIIVFRTHPLDMKSNEIASYIRKMAKDLDISDSVVVIRSGAIGKLTKRSSGMIVINSTSAFFAIFHCIPVLVLGDAVYRHESIVTVGYGPESIVEFLSNRSLQDREVGAEFIEAVKATALLPGDFYSFKSQRITAKNVVTKVETLVESSDLFQEVVQ